MSIVIKDHLGQEFKSIAAMCRHWNINVYTFLGRKFRGRNIEDSLTERVLSGNRIPARDHLGKDYVSLSAMARAYGLSPSALYRRLNKGKQLKDALTHKVFDHLGNEFSSKREMCKAYNLSITTFNSRLFLGWSLKEALTKPIDKKRSTRRKLTK